MNLKELLFAISVSILPVQGTATSEEVIALLGDMVILGHEPQENFLVKVEVLRLEMIRLQEQGISWTEVYPQLAECDVNALNYIKVTQSLRSGEGNLEALRGYQNMMIRSMEMCLNAKFDLL